MKKEIPSHWREVQLGVIEFHSERLNPGLIKRFYEVRDDLTAAACIVDLWLLDIRAVLREFGYEMKVYSTKEPAASTVMDAEVPHVAE